jgi:serine/alanine adding enzyme
LLSDLGLLQQMDYYFITDSSIIDEADWITLVNDHPQGNVFYLPSMLRLYERTSGNQPVFLACVDASNKIQGLIVGVIQSSVSRWTKIITSRCIIWGGPLVKDNSPFLIKLLLQELDKFIGEKVVYLQFRNLKEVLYAKNIFLENNYSYDDHLDILIDLKNGKEVIWQKFSSTRKKQILRSIKRGCLIENKDSLDLESLEKCYDLLKVTYNRIGLPYPDKDFFKVAFNEPPLKSHIKAFFAIFENRIIAFRFVLIYKDLIYDWYAASDREYQDKYPNDLLPWEIFKWGIENGYKIFDFGGAGKPGEKYGVRDYKSKFGGELVNYGRFNKIKKPGIYFMGKSLIKLSRYLKSLYNNK